MVNWEQLELWAGNSTHWRLSHTLPSSEYTGMSAVNHRIHKRAALCCPGNVIPLPYRVLWPKCNLAKIMASNSSLNRLCDTFYAQRDRERGRERQTMQKWKWSFWIWNRIGMRFARPDSLVKVRAYAFCSACLVIKLSTCSPPTYHATCHMPLPSGKRATCNWQPQKASPCWLWIELRALNKGFAQQQFV